MAGYQLPQFQYPTNATLDFSPITQGLNVLGKTWEHNRKTDDWNALFQGKKIGDTINEGGWETTAYGPSPVSQMGINPALANIARTMGYEQGPNALMQAYAQQEQRKMQAAAQAEAIRQHNSTIALQQQQLTLAKQAEGRNAQRMPYELDQLKAQSESARAAANKQAAIARILGETDVPDPNTLPNAAPPLPPMRSVSRFRSTRTSSRPTSANGRA